MRGRKNRKKEGGRQSAGRDMKKQDLENLRDCVPCAAVLVRASFALDVKESTRRAVKYRRGAEIIIVIHDGRGWFDPLSDAKGDVFRLAEYVGGISFVEALDQIAALVGIVVNAPGWTGPVRNPAPADVAPKRWAKRRKPWRGSMTWRYLREERCLSEPIIRAAVQADLLREGPHGSMWAAHRDDRGVVTGWEERGPQWRGFSTGGSKVLFRLGAVDGSRLCVTEAAIDAMSLAAFEGLREGSLYLSTGGGWSLTTDHIRHFHGYCDLADKGSPERMRNVIMEHETRPVRAMTREERLEHIWSSTADDYRGYAGERWPSVDRGKRTVLLYGGNNGSFLKRLDQLTDAEISAKLPVHLRYLPDAIAA